MEKKTVKSITGRKTEMLKMDPHGGGFFACCWCGFEINKGDFYTVCNDCGGYFCETCVVNGTFEKHVCDEEDEVP